MQQNNHHIENNFAKIEHEAEADLSQMDVHWANMKNALALQTPKMTAPKKWLWASLPIIVIVGLILFFANYYSNKKNNTVEENKWAIDVKKDLLDTTILQKSTIPVNQHNLTNASSTSQSNSNFQIPNITLSKIILPHLLIPNTANNENLNSETYVTIKDTSYAKIFPIDDTIKLNNELEHMQKVEMLQAFIAKIKKKGELFTINNLRDTTIQAAEGTVFYIPMNCFDTKDSVVFEVKEYYKYADMVANGLTTMADEKQLISGGMLSLTATVKGKEIALNPTKEIRVFIPNLTAKDSMEIFEGEKKITQDYNINKPNVIAQNNINWKLTKVRVDSAVIKMYLRAIDLTDDEIIYKITNNGRAKAIFFKAKNSELSKSELLKMLKAKHGNYYDIIKLRNLSWATTAFHYTDITPYVYNNFTGVGDTSEYSPRMIEIYKLKTIDTVYKVERWINKGFFTTNRPSFAVNTLNLIGEKYSIGINKLGWINCDRFFNYAGKKSNVVIDLNDSAFSYITYIVLDKYKSIMQGLEKGNMVLFPNIPMGEPVKIISIGIKDGKTVTAMKNIITSANIVSDLPFEQTSSSDFKASLNVLDN